MSSSTVGTVFVAVLDQLIDEYCKDTSIIFVNEAEQKKYLFLNLDNIAKAWKKAGRCMVPTCTRSSIARSHAVPRGMLADQVGEAGHVLTPARRRPDGALILERVGLVEASTFPGFCETHELLYQGFETAKLVSSEREAILQAYRTACRELFRTRFWIEKIERMIAEFESLRDQRLVERLKGRLAEAGIDAGSLTKVTLHNDPLMASWVPRLAGLKELNQYLDSQLVPALESAVFGTDTSKLYMWAVTLDVDLPVGLVGATSIRSASPGATAEACFVMTILPQSNGFLLSVVGVAADQSDLTAYVARWTTNALDMLSMVESWMINGTDQWYLRPSTWQQLGADRQRKILDEIEHGSHSVMYEARQAIFADLRQTILAEFEAVHAGRADEAYLRYVERQRSKCRGVDPSA